MHPYKEINKVNAQIEAVMSSVIPSQLSDYKEGLLSKLKAEKSRLESTWFDDDVHVRRPSMAIIKFDSVLTDCPVELFGSDIPSQSIVNISVYSAKFNKLTKEYEPVEMIASCQASESQYADMLTNTNQDHSSCVTFGVVDGQEVDDYSPLNDPTKDNFKAIVEKAKESNTSNESKLEEINEIVSKLDAGKLTKSEVKKLVRALSNLSSMEKGNSEFRMEQVSEGIDERLRDTLLNIDGAANLAINQCVLEKKS